MKKLSKINEDLFHKSVEREYTGDARKEDIPVQDPIHWWRYIKIDSPEKYSNDDISSWSITDMMVKRVEKTMGVTKPEYIDVFFKNEVWDLTIEHNTSYGNDRYTMNVHGAYSPWYEPFSKLSKLEKRSIRQRLDKKKFYVYTYDRKGYRVEYYLREEPEFKGKKGILLK